MNWRWYLARQKIQDDGISDKLGDKRLTPIDSPLSPPSPDPALGSDDENVSPARNHPRKRQKLWHITKEQRVEITAMTKRLHAAWDGSGRVIKGSMDSMEDKESSASWIRIFMRHAVVSYFVDRFCVAHINILLLRFYHSLYCDQMTSENGCNWVKIIYSMYYTTTIRLTSARDVPGFRQRRIIRVFSQRALPV